MSVVLIISLLLFIATILISLKEKLKLEKAIRIFAIGTFAVAILLLLPLIIEHNKLSSEGDQIPLVTVVLAVLQLGSLDGDYPLWITQAGSISVLYRVFVSIICYCMPLVFGGFILSLFEGVVGILKYHFVKHHKDIFYFSELNQNSLLLAKSIHENNRKSLIVFYDFDGNCDLKEEALSNGFLILDYDYEKIITKPSHKIHYLMIKENQDKNLSEGLKILNLLKSRYLKTNYLQNVSITIFSENKESEVILNSTDKKDITVRLINEHQQKANELIFNHPFYETQGWKEKNLTSVTVIGAGELGLAVIKNALWSCQFGSNYKFKINVIDRNAISIKSKLEHDCPEIFQAKWKYDITFWEADVRESSFNDILEKYCMDTTYVVVCLDNDELSIDTALFIRRFFISEDENFRNEPFIAVRISDDEKLNSVKELTAVNREKISLKGWDIYSSKSENFNLIPFGGTSSIYSYEGVINNELEKLAVNAHAEYQNMFTDTSITEYEILKTFNYSELDKKSNYANVLHIKYKLKFLGYEIKPYSKANDDERKKSEQNLLKLKEIFSDEKTMDYLCRLEHDRWLSFFISEGWRGVSINEAKRYAEKTGNHKNIKAKLHPCICTWEELDEVITTFDPHLKDYDKQFVLRIPQILGMEDSSINVSKIRYVLLECK